MADIKVEQTNIKIEDNDSILVTPTTNIPIAVDASNRVTMAPRSYHIVSPDIYTIKRNNAPDPWFMSMLDNAIDNSDLADEVSDLDNQFDNFSDGITLQIGYLQDADVKLAYDISINKVANDNNTAGISHLNVTKVTADEATAISQATIGAWSNGGEGGAWFDSKVSTVSNVAYSAAKSASTLTASINSQQDQLNAIVGDVDVLQAQVDGKVETWTGTHPVIDSNGDLLVSAEPYATWLAVNDVARHTGDTYVKTELDPATNKATILATLRFAGTDTNGTIDYNWYVFQDDLASLAYQQSLDAGILADGKITTYYQTFEPSIVTYPEMGEGDLWLDSDADNKMYRYQGAPLAWIAVEDKRIEASVTRLDEVSVDVNGEARAKSSLSVDANGVIGGFVAESDGSTSSFKIFADKFTITNSQNGSDAGAPFAVDTTTGQIGFTGNVTFKGTPAANALQPGEAINDVNSNYIPGTTQINGGAIQADSLNADTIQANGSLSSPNINGGVINGGLIKGSIIEGAVIRASYLDLDGDIEVLTDFHISTASYTANPARYIDAVFIDIDNEYRIPTLSKAQDITTELFGGYVSTGTYEGYYDTLAVGSEAKSSIYTYDMAKAKSNSKARKKRPTITCLNTSQFIYLWASAGGHCSGDYGTITASFWLGGVKLFSMKNTLTASCSGGEQQQTCHITNYYGTSVSLTYTTFAQTFVSAGITFETSGKQDGHYDYRNYSYQVHIKQGSYTPTIDVDGEANLYKCVYDAETHGNPATHTIYLNTDKDIVIDNILG